MDTAGVLAAEEDARRLGGNPVPGVLEGVLLVPAGVLEGVLPPAELFLGVSYAPAISPPATGVRPPPLLLLFPDDFPPPAGTGVRTVPPLPLLEPLPEESSAGLPNETADSDRLGGAAVPETCPDLSPLDAMMILSVASELYTAHCLTNRYLPSNIRLLDVALELLSGIWLAGIWLAGIYRYWMKDPNRNQTTK